MEKELLRFAQLNNLLWEQIKDAKAVVVELRDFAAALRPVETGGEVGAPSGPSEEDRAAALKLTEKIVKRMEARNEAADARRKELQEKIDNGGLSEEEEEEYLSMWKYH